MTDLDTVQIVQRQDSNTDYLTGLYQSVGDIIDPVTFVSSFGNDFPQDLDFARIVFESEVGLELGQKPKLSSKGTSGCYFIHDRYGVSGYLSVTPCLSPSV